MKSTLEEIKTKAHLSQFSAFCNKKKTRSTFLGLNLERLTGIPLSLDTDGIYWDFLIVLILMSLL